METTDNISRYFADIGDQEFLSKEEEQVIFRRVDRARKEISEILNSIFKNSIDQNLAIFYLNKIRLNKTYAIGISLDYDISISDLEEKSARIKVCINTINQGREEIIGKNLKLVAKYARKFEKRTNRLELDDLIQEGNFGLMDAFEKFDVDRGNKFTTYAVYWIQHNLSKAVATQDQPIRIPSHIYQLIGKINSFERRFNIDYHRLPSIEEIIDQIKVTEDKPEKMIEEAIVWRDIIKSSISLEQSTDSEDDEWTLRKQLGTEDPEYNKILDHTEWNDYINERLEKIFSRMTNSEKNVLIQRLTLDKQKTPLDIYQISDLLNIPAPRIFHIESLALRKVKHQVDNTPLTEVYVG